jgi:hypothetical protein
MRACLVSLPLVRPGVPPFYCFYSSGRCFLVNPVNFVMVIVKLLFCFWPPPVHAGKRPPVRGAERFPSRPPLPLRCYPPYSFRLNDCDSNFVVILERKHKTVRVGQQATRTAKLLAFFLRHPVALKRKGSVKSPP